MVVLPFGVAHSLRNCLRLNMAVKIWLCAFVFVLVVVTPTYCNAVRTLRDSSERSLVEESYESEKRSSRWSDRQSGDDAVPMLSEGADNHAIKYREWVRLQEVLMQDYSNDPAAANPSTPFP